MVRKLLFLLLLLLLLPAFAFAATEKVIHNEWHTYHDFFTIGSDYYEVTNTHYVSSDNILTKTLLNYNQAGFILSADAPLVDDAYVVQKESCKRNGLYRYCILNVSLQPTEGARADESGQYHYGTRIKIYEEIPDEALLTVTHELDASSLHVGEKTKMTIRVYNKGLKTAMNINLNETVASGFLVTEQSGFDAQYGNKFFVSKPSLAPGDEFIARVWVQVVNPAEGTTLASVVSYDAPAKKTASATSTISVPIPYVFSYKAAATSVKISVPATMTYTITNKDIIPANISVFFNLPNDMYVTKSLGFSSVTDSSYDGVLLPNEEILFSKTLQTDFTGKSDYAIDVSFKIRDEVYTDHRAGSIAISSGKVTPSITTGTPVALSGKLFTYGLYAHNDDPTQTFYSINGWVGTDFFNNTFELKSISPGQDSKLSFMTYTLPQVDQATVYTIKAQGSFLTHSGELSTFSTQKDITILPKNQTLVLLEKVDKTSLKRGETLTITVTAQNLASSGQQQISALSNYDSLLEKTFGDKSAEVYLYGGEKKELYVLKLKVPFDYYKDSFNISTVLNNAGLAHSSQVHTIKVTDPVAKPEGVVDEPDVSVTTTNSTGASTSNNSTSPYPVTTPSHKEAGFISKFLDSIGDFFASLFK